MKNEKIITLQFNKERANIELKEFKTLYDRHQQTLSFMEEGLRDNIISRDEVRRRREEMNKTLQAAVLNIHKCAISQGKGKDTRWYTPVMKGGKRIILKKPTYDELMNALVDFYGMRKKHTLRTLFPIWLESMLKQGHSSGYIRRIVTDWETYYVNDPIVDKEIEKLTINTIKDWLATQITTHQMRAKKFYNMQTIFKQIFRYAYEEELIRKNPFDRISFPKALYFKGETSKVRRMAQSKEQVFTKEETQKIKEVAMQAYLKDPSFTTATAPLGILLLFETGLRVGELVALREENIFEDHLEVECEEQREYQISIDKRTNEVKCTYMGTIVGDAKTNASYRTIPLTKEARRLIGLIRKANEENGFKVEDFLFVNATQRMQENTILKHLYKYCEEANIEKRSPHKIRKTFASNLVNGGNMDLSEVASLLGHVSESTLINHYLYSTREKDTRLQRMEESLAM